MPREKTGDHRGEKVPACAERVNKGGRESQRLTLQEAGEIGKLSTLIGN